MARKPHIRLIAAVHTPMHRDQSLDLNVVDMQADLVAAQGLDGVFVAGTTGEGLALTTDERRRLTERWLEAAKGRLDVFVHVAHPVLRKAAILAQHAERAGARAIAAIAPLDFPPSSVENLVAWCAVIAAAAPKTPFYYYHIPARTKLPFKGIDFLRAAAERIPNLRGLKFTDCDLVDLGNCLDFQDGRFEMLSGQDAMLLASLATGAAGGLGGTYAFAGRLYRQLADAFADGDIAKAQSLQGQVRRMFGLICSTGNQISAGKWLMGQIGVDCGPVRAASGNLPPEKLAALRRTGAAGIL